MFPQCSQNLTYGRQPAFSTAASEAATAGSLRKERFIIRVTAAVCALGVLYLTSAQLAEAAPTVKAAAKMAPAAAPSFPHCEGEHGHPPAGPLAALPHSGPPALPPFFGLLRQLDLSEAQDDKIFALMHTQVPVLREQERNAHKAVDALRQLAASPDYDPTKARELIARHTQAISAVLLQRAETDAAVLAVLTKEQRGKLDALLQDSANRPQHPHPMHPPLPPLARINGQPPLTPPPAL
jgi:Spy/CpxP family protein refolding chaperone